MTARPEAGAPEVVCPACGRTVYQVASATLGLALWQHSNWACPIGHVSDSYRTRTTELSDSGALRETRRDAQWARAGICTR